MASSSRGFGCDWILYLRKSKGRAGIPRQRKDCEALLEEYGGEILKEFVDEDSTAFTKVGAETFARRDDYQAMLAYLRASRPGGRVGVLAWHADRVHRNPAEVETFIVVCAEGRIPVVTARSGSYELWTPTGRKRIRQDAVDAAYEVDHLTERVVSHKDEAARAGRTLGGPAPFGWRWKRLSVDDEHRVLVVEPAEAEAVLWGAKALLRGASLMEVAREWNRRGLRRRSGKEWDSGTLVRSVLERPGNAGFMVHRGRIIETTRPGGKGEWEPILPEEIWNAVVSLLRDPARRTAVSSTPKWLGSGLYRCGVPGCGEPLGAGATSPEANGKPRAVYRCRNGSTKQHVSRDARLLDAFVEKALILRLSRPDLLALACEGQTADMEGLQARLSAEETELGSWRRLAKERKVSALTFAEMEPVILERIAEIKSEMEQAVRTPVLMEVLDEIRGAGKVGFEEVRAFWDAKRRDDLLWCRSVLLALVTVTVLPTKGGRPPGWRPGEPYFNYDAIRFDWRSPSS